MLKRRLQEPFGKAGLTVAVIALVMALVGGAYAAGGLTKSQEKQVKKIAKKYAGKPGATGPAGPAGPVGAAGKGGTNGTNGKSVAVTAIATGGPECAGNGGAEVKQEGAGSGVEVCNGQTGFVEVLPAEKTEKGTWTLTTARKPEGAAFPFPLSVTAISFPIPLSSAPEAHVITPEGKEMVEVENPPGSEEFELQEVTPTECGSALGAGVDAENPQAPPGVLCLYVAQNFENLTPFIRAPTFGSHSFGVEATFIGGSPGASLRGTWAVTSEAE